MVCRQTSSCEGMLIGVVYAIKSDVKEVKGDKKVLKLDGDKLKGDGKVLKSDEKVPQKLRCVKGPHKRLCIIQGYVEALNSKNAL